MEVLDVWHAILSPLLLSVSQKLIPARRVEEVFLTRIRHILEAEHLGRVLIPQKVVVGIVFRLFLRLVWNLVTFDVFFDLEPLLTLSLLSTCDYNILLVRLADRADAQVMMEAPLVLLN